jgi:hypothetical protein
MGATHFPTRALKRIRTEMSLQIIAYNIQRVIAIMGVRQGIRIWRISADLGLRRGI